VTTAAIVPTAVPTLSIVVPLLNEEDSLAELHQNIAQALTAWDGRYEIVFVDDGSTDGTLERLKTLERNDPRVRVFAFRRNLGKSQALQCGFLQARGDLILTMDGDLQDVPANFAELYARMTTDDADVVSGWRRDRRDNLWKKLTSRLFNAVIVLLFGRSFRDMNSGLKLYRAGAARALRLYGGMYRFIPLIATELGYRVVEHPVRHGERKYGGSKYSAAKVVTEMPDLLTVFFLIKYTTRPLHFFVRGGSVLIAMGMAMLLYLTFLWFRSIPIGTRPLLNLGVLLVVIGGQTVFTGLLADLIVNIHADRRQDFPLKYASTSTAPSAERS
jgi:glycosyltransferase involved in cell wall biosynthesis